MRLAYHREKTKPRLSTTLGWLSGVALAVLPLVAYGWDTDLGAPPPPSISDGTSEPEAPDWEQVSNNGEIAGSDGPVLELPSVAPVSASVSADSASAELANETTADDEEGSDSTDDRVGDLSEYEEQESVPSALPLWPPPVAVVTMPLGYAGMTYMPPPSVIVVRPGGLTPIPATSPMLSMPRSTHFVGGWWNRVR